MIRLVGAAAAFTGTVLGGLILGIVVDRATGGSVWALVGLLAGLVCGIGAVAAALLPLMRAK